MTDLRGRTLALAVAVAVAGSDCSRPILANDPILVEPPPTGGAEPSRAADPIPVTFPRDDGPHHRLYRSNSPKAKPRCGLFPQWPANWPGYPPALAEQQRREFAKVTPPDAEAVLAGGGDPGMLHPSGIKPFMELPISGE